MVVTRAGNRTAAVCALTAAPDPDVVLLDLRAGFSRLDLARHGETLAPHSQVIVMSVLHTRDRQTGTCTGCMPGRRQTVGHVRHARHSFVKWLDRTH